MPRHRGQFKPEQTEPYELSRSRIENFIRCPACFYLQQVKGVKFPSIPGFNINEATDILLKRDFDIYREKQQPHPFMVKRGLGHIIPFQHDDFELWTQSLHFGADGRFNTVHADTNLKVGGGLDDVWLNTKTNQLHIVDYKSTSTKSAGKSVNLEGPWKEAYKRQMDFYVWVMRQKGFGVSDIGYFLYCDGDRFTDEAFLNEADARMIFKMSLLEYKVDTSWVEPALISIKELLGSNDCPAHTDTCEHGAFLAQVEALS